VGVGVRQCALINTQIFMLSSVCMFIGLPACLLASSLVSQIQPFLVYWCLPRLKFRLPTLGFS